MAKPRSGDDPPQADRPETDRSGGGPGSSHQGGSHGHATRQPATEEGGATSTAKSRVSGGGGERDSHHTHDPGQKGDRKGN